MPTRTIAIPVAEIIEGGTKSQFYAELKELLDTCRKAANKAVAICLAADQDLMSGGKCPKLYTYPHIASSFPGIAIVAATIGRAVESKYRTDRWQVYRGNQVATYRSYPLPLLHNQSGKTIRVEMCEQFITVEIKLKQWWKVRLAGGSSHRDQIAGIRASQKIGDSKILIDRKNRAILNLSCDMPVKENKEKRGVLNVLSTREALLVATKERSETPFVITGDVLRGIVVQREKERQRLSCDRKSGTKRSVVKALQNRNSEKWNRRIKSLIHEMSAHLVAHAERRNVEVLQLDFTVKSFLPKFPWFELSSMIKYKCEDAGIVFQNATQQVSEPDVQKPHVYFKFSPSTLRVKIGRTSRNDGGRHGAETDSAEELVILAVDNQPRTKLVQREKHFHSQFANWREKGEWFQSGPVVQWLRDVGWLGNAGNISQIAQVLDV